MNMFNATMTDEELESWRYVQDDYADSVAATLLESRYAKDIYPSMAHIVNNTHQISADVFRNGTPEAEFNEEHERLVQVLTDYFNDQHLFPQSQEEYEIIHRGCEFFDLHVGDCLFALTLRSLLKQYSAFKATNVLVATKLLVDYPHRRIVETLQFVADVMEDNGFQPEGNAIRSIQKLRLVHAMIRHRINKKKSNPDYQDSAITMMWDDAWGLPINQQDMIFAVHTFSIEVIDGLLANGVKVPQQDIDDYYMTWHLYGRALGVNPDLNPTSYAEGKKLQSRIYKSQFIPNQNALALTTPLIDFSRTFLPFSPGVTHIYAMIKRYNDPVDYKPVFEDILKLPIGNAHLGWMIWFFILEHALEAIDAIRRLFVSSNGEEKQYSHRVANRNQRMIQALVDMNKTWTSRHFRIADGFGDSASKVDARNIQTEPTFFQRLGKVLKWD